VKLKFIFRFEKCTGSLETSLTEGSSIDAKIGRIVPAALISGMTGMRKSSGRTPSDARISRSISPWTPPEGPHPNMTSFATSTARLSQRLFAGNPRVAPCQKAPRQPLWNRTAPPANITASAIHFALIITISLSHSARPPQTQAKSSESACGP